MMLRGKTSLLNSVAGPVRWDPLFMTLGIMILTKIVLKGRIAIHIFSWIGSGILDPQNCFMITMEIFQQLLKADYHSPVKEFLFSHFSPSSKLL